MALSKVPPHNESVELAVLGAMLLERKAVAEAADLLVAEDFYSPAYSQIFGAILKLYDQNHPVDIVTVGEALRANGILEKVGGIERLADILESAVTTSNIEYHCKIVKEMAIRRGLVGVSRDLAQKCYNASEPVEGVLEGVQRDLLKCTLSRRDRSAPFGTVLFEVVDRVGSGEPPAPGVSTGFRDLDNYLGGFHSGEFILLAARPSIGKTTLALNIARRMGKAGKRILLISLEMQTEALSMNLLAAQAKIDGTVIRAAQIPRDRLSTIAQAAGELAMMDLVIKDDTGITPWAIKREVRDVFLEKPCDLIIVDYLQLMSIPKIESRVHMVTEISGQLKGLARELRTPVLALSQLSRGTENRANKMPYLSDLRDSGALEQDADVVMFLYRPDALDPQREPGVAYLKIAKQRNGPTGTLRLTFRKNLLRFEDWFMPQGPQAGPADTPQGLQAFPGSP